MLLFVKFIVNEIPNIDNSRPETAIFTWEYYLHVELYQGAVCLLSTIVYCQQLELGHVLSTEP